MEYKIFQRARLCFLVFVYEKNHIGTFNIDNLKLQVEREIIYSLNSYGTFHINKMPPTEIREHYVLL